MQNARTVTEIEKEIASIKDALQSVKGSDTEVYARIVGYYRSVKNWNKGKRDEFDQRKLFEVKEASCNCHAEIAEPQALLAC